MAKTAITNTIAGKVLGAGLALSAAAFPAVAQDTAPADAAQPAAMTHAEEIAQLNAATVAAHDYSVDNNGVGILIHVGLDIPNDTFATPDQFGQALVAVFKQKYGTDSQYFLRQNDAAATGLEYWIDGLLHGADDGTELKLVGEAIAAMPEVAGLLRELKTDELARATFDAQNPQPGG